MIFCTNCGSQVAEGLKFCAECGTTVEVKGGAGAAGGNQIESFKAALQNIPKYRQALALAVVSSVLVLVFLMSNLVSSGVDAGGMMGMPGIDDVSTNGTVFTSASTFRTMINSANDAVDAQIEWYIDRFDPTRSEIRELRAEARDELREELGPVITASRFYRFVSVFVVISILLILAFLYLLMVEHPMATLVGLAGTGFAALTTLIILIGTPRVQSAFADSRELRDIFSVSNSFWIWPTLIIAAAAVWFVFSLKKLEAAKPEA